MSISMTRELARFVYGLNYDRLERHVVEKVKTCVLDAIACSCGGYRLPWSKTAVKLAGEQSGREEATLWIHGVKGSFGYAAMANTVLSHSIIQEDMHAETAAHIGSVVIPAAFAMGEKLQCTGRELIVAIVAGYEVMGRVGKALASAEFSRRGFRPSGIFGPFGSAAAGAKLLHLDEDAVVTALGLAGNFSAGVNEWAHAGTSDIFFHNGFASHNGLMAAYLAQNGVTAPERIVEGKAGVANAWAGGPEDRAGSMDDFGKVFEIERVYHKPAPACAFTQETAQAALKLIGQYEIVPEEIDEITVSAYPMVKNYTGCDYSGPFSSLVQAQMSNQFAVAAVLLHKETDFRHYLDFANPRIYDIARKVKIQIDPEAEAVFPRQKRSTITVRTRDGKVYVAEQKDLESLTHKDIVKKLTSLSADWFEEKTVATLIAAIDRLEQVGTVSEITGLLKSDKAGA